MLLVYCVSIYVVEKLIITETARLFSSRRPENCDVMQAANEIVALFPGEKMVLNIYFTYTLACNNLVG